ncbi:lethal(3)malignant brain tumor-like protein 3 isoform X2 [Daphnia magna]|uniref:lethal(3)malignant brain tumor-like protein 3 isoform X2 n=1 Tax=Daphnia magna TaxID=35525 RepID=UPI001E1BCA4C|nr:lethal(3)malignant brain tumor-like protein 3 isoform X2 [Daphnia magna]
MNSETETPDSTSPTIDAPIAPATENTPFSGETTVIVNLTETATAPPSSSITSTVEEESDLAETAANVSNISSKYPKLNLRVNEFGIYELVPGEESTAEKPTAEKPNETIQITEVVSAEKELSPEAIVAPPSTDADSIPQPTKPVAEMVPVSLSHNNGNGSSSSNNNGDRERWKQRFPSNTKEKVDIVCCKQCDGYGIADEFVDQYFCSEKCRKLSVAQPTKSKSREGGAAAGKVAVKRKSTSSNSSSQAGDAANNAIVESSLEPCNEQTNKDGDLKPAKSSSAWSWSKYLERRRAQAAPERLFSDPFPYGKHGFRSGMKLEGIDPEHQSLFCVMTVAEIQGYRLRLHFDGYSDSHDFWLNADSENLFHCGWCEKNGQKLRPPKHYELPTAQSTSSPLPPHHQTSAQPSTHARTFSWPQYLKFTSSVAAPRHLFISAQNESPVPSAFRVKMKLEAVDRRHSSHTLCVATVANVIGSRFLVHFDGWDSIYDYWADPTCPYVHPVGWAQEHNTTLTPPCDYDAEAGDFVWDHYLAKTGSTAVPPRAFKPRSPVGFKTGMKLECVDPRNPQLIRVATVAAVKGYRLKIHFDGWSSDYDFWTDDDWPDLHPPGWCLKTGHPLQPPFVTYSGSSTTEGECSTPGCTGAGHVEGARYATHTTVDHCPYSSSNLHRENPAFPDRLTGEEIDPVVQRPSSPEVVASIAEEDHVKEEPSIGNKTKATIIKIELETGERSGIAPTVESSSPPPQSSSTTSVKKMEEQRKSKVSEIIDLPVKSESEAELNNRLIQVDIRAESPSLEQQYDSLETLTPPPKKIRLSYFTGKTAASDNVRRKSAVLEDREKTNGDVPHDQSLPATERRRKDEPSRNSLAGQNDQFDTSMSCSVQAQKSMQPGYSMMDFPTNSNLTTPMCWSKHAALLGDLVGVDTSNQVALWSCDQVLEFLSKFGISKPLLEKFKQEEIDGEALLYLSQSDLTDLLSVKLGPAIKIRNALLLMKEKAKSAMPSTNEAHS